jgi:hypothetical protein
MMSGMRPRLVRGSARLNLIGAFALSLSFLGCVSDRPPPPGRVGRTKGPIDQIHLTTGTTALNLDRVPGPDGFGVRVFASSSQTPMAVVILSGTLEILMFDGLLKETNAASAKPLRIWTYTPADLKNCAQNSVVGMAYLLTPLWGDAKPTQHRITLVARYVPKKGVPIYSAASAISVAVK